jgi:hypothetical protein
VAATRLAVDWDILRLILAHRLNTNKEALKGASGFVHDKTKTAWVLAAK